MKCHNTSVHLSIHHEANCENIDVVLYASVNYFLSRPKTMYSYELQLRVNYVQTLKGVFGSHNAIMLFREL